MNRDNDEKQPPPRMQQRRAKQKEQMGKHQGKMKNKPKSKVSKLAHSGKNLLVSQRSY